MKTEWTLDTLDEVVAKLRALRELHAEYELRVSWVQTERPKRQVYRYHLRVTSVPGESAQEIEEGKP